MKRFLMSEFAIDFDTAIKYFSVMNFGAAQTAQACLCCTCCMCASAGARGHHL